MHDLRPIAAWTVLALTPALFGRCQAISNPNQIVGDVRFTNENPDVLAILGPPGNEGLSGGGSSAAGSVDHEPHLSHSSGLVADSPLTGHYEVTVESSEEGIAYRVRASGRLRGGSAFYFSPVVERSAPVYPEPAEDVRVDFEGCAGILDLTFLDGDGGPTALEGGTVRIGGGSQTIPPGASEMRIILAGWDQSYRGTVRYVYGTDPEHDTIRREVSFDVVVRCDEIVALDVTCEGTGSGAGQGLGRIIGEIDVLGVDEHQAFNPSARDWADGSCLTMVRAGGGPFGNERFDCLDGDPSSGSFELERLVPSNEVTPPQSYSISTLVKYGAGRRIGRVRWPYHLVEVGGGETLDIGDLFVMDPGHVRCSIHLAGPPQAAEFGMPILAAFPEHPESLWAFLSGQPGVAEGATSSAVGIRVDMIGAGSYDEDKATMEGDAELVAGGLQREPGIFGEPILTLRAKQTPVPEDPLAQVRLSHSIQDHGRAPFTVSPGSTTELEERYCLSQVHIGFHALSGVFHRPRLRGSGEFEGLDFEGRESVLELSFGALGTPSESEDASDRGLVRAALTQGRYDVEADIVFHDPSGGVSITELPGFELQVGCRQLIERLPELAVVRAFAPPCAANSVEVVGSVDSEEEIASVTWSLDGSAPVEICTDCGLNPSFVFRVVIPDADSRIMVEATDRSGRVARTTTFTRFAREPSALDQRPTAPPLLVSKLDTALALEWEPGTGASANLYQGSLDWLHDHRGYDHGSTGACQVTAGRAERATPPGNAYYLVGGSCAWGDGSLGRDSFDRERTMAAPACLP